jgi:hypothetical protein
MAALAYRDDKILARNLLLRPFFCLTPAEPFFRPDRSTTAPLCRVAVKDGRAFRGHPKGLSLVCQAWALDWRWKSSAERVGSNRELKATACRDRRRETPKPWRREAVWGRSRRHAAAPNESEALDRPGRSGERAKERNARNPTEIGAVLRPGAAVHSVSLPWEICMGPRER